jgi:hypothetical protein
MSSVQLPPIYLARSSHQDQWFYKCTGFLHLLHASQDWPMGVKDALLQYSMWTAALLVASSTARIFAARPQYPQAIEVVCPSPQSTSRSWSSSCQSTIWRTFAHRVLLAMFIGDAFLGLL